MLELESRDILYSDVDQTLAGAAMTVLALGRVLGYLDGQNRAEFLDTWRSFAREEIHPTRTGVRTLAYKSPDRQNIWLLNNQNLSVPVYEYKRGLASVLHDKGLYTNMTQIPGAKSGLELLTTLCNLEYRGALSARPAEPEIQQATSEWLREREFQGDQLVYLTGTLDAKMDFLIKESESLDIASLLLIVDDRPQSLIKYAYRLASQQRDNERLNGLLRKIVVIAYGYVSEDLVEEKSISRSLGLHLITLQNWERTNVLNATEQISYLQNSFFKH